MVSTYCTVEQVASRCNFLAASSQARAIFGTDPKIPDRDEIEDMINEAEEWINKECRTAWGALFLQITNELQSLHYDFSGSSVHLNFPNVMDFETSEGDKLEIWDGSDWIDWIVEKTEGRGDDFFVDYTLGKVYFISTISSTFTRRDKSNIRITYRVNNSPTVPLPISYAASYLAGINILNSEYSTVAFPEGEGEELSNEQMISRWWRMIKRKLRPYLRSGLHTGTAFDAVRIR